ncbi:MAG: 16S rRNA (guanine(966)-N(2))-methyltransferase RsmD [Clostridia bacterium]|nr:16S rRNA (guanine(966)-N(2))-methyltransferase RsmD [Clostridia bacterium]
MRIVGGKHKGRKLFTPDNYDVRPTADNVREALFNILGNISKKRFFDVFGGSGAVALEAVSRGAIVDVNDRNEKSVALIKKNFDLCREAATITRLDAVRAIKSKTNPFDIIFLDPPYAMDVTSVLEALATSSIVNDDTLIIYEKAYKDPVPSFPGYDVVDQRKYGIVGLVFYRKTKQEIEPPVETPTDEQG